MSGASAMLSPQLTARATLNDDNESKSSESNTQLGHEGDLLYNQRRFLRPLSAFHSHDDCWSSLRNFAQNITLIGQGVALVRRHGTWLPFICNTPDV